MEKASWQKIVDINDNDVRDSRGLTGKVLSQGNSRNTQTARKAMEMRKD